MIPPTQQPNQWHKTRNLRETGFSAVTGAAIEFPCVSCLPWQGACDLMFEPSTVNTQQSNGPLATTEVSPFRASLPRPFAGQKITCIGRGPLCRSASIIPRILRLPVRPTTAKMVATGLIVSHRRRGMLEPPTCTFNREHRWFLLTCTSTTDGCTRNARYQLNTDLPSRGTSDGFDAVQPLSSNQRLTGWPASVRYRW